MFKFLVILESMLSRDWLSHLFQLSESFDQVPVRQIRNAYILLRQETCAIVHFLSLFLPDSLRDGDLHTCSSGGASRLFDSLFLCCGLHAILAGDVPEILGFLSGSTAAS